MANMASKIRVLHYATIPPKHDSKTILTLCGHRLPLKETTADEKAVSCFLCHQALQAKGADHNDKAE